MPSFGLCGVILAAGQSSRMGRDKALWPWPKIDDATTNPNRPPRGTLLSSAIRALSDYCELVIVVAGANAENLRPVVDGCGANLVVNPAPERGQFSSLQVGLQEVLNRGRDKAMLTLVDRPPLRAETLCGLVEAFCSRPHTVWSLIPEFEGKHGHPILIGREMIEVFLKAPVNSSAREIEHAHQSRISYFETIDPLVVANIDTPDAYASLECAP